MPGMDLFSAAEMDVMTIEARQSSAALGIGFNRSVLQKLTRRLTNFYRICSLIQKQVVSKVKKV